MTTNQFMNDVSRITQILYNAANDTTIPPAKRDGMAIVAEEWLRTTVKRATLKQQSWFQENYPHEHYRHFGY